MYYYARKTVDMINTNCKKCIFSGKYSSKTSCELGIIDYIKDKKQITVKNDYNYIHNYSCSYAMDRDFYEKYIEDKIGSHSIYDMVIINRAINYYMIVNLEKSKNLQKICDKINKLSIKPKRLSIYSQEFLDTSILKSLKVMHWKVHRYVEVESFDSMIYGSMSTFNKNDIKYIWTVSENFILSSDIEKNIQNINTITNIDQDDNCNALTSQHTDNEVDGLFITLENYQNLTHKFNQSILHCINNFPNFVLGYYD